MAELLSATHDESRLAACPLSDVPGRVRAPVQERRTLAPGCSATLLGLVGRHTANYGTPLLQSCSEKIMVSNPANCTASSTGMDV